MPFIPHTEKDTSEMLEAIGVDSIADLFDEIPPELMIEHLPHVPPAVSEMEISRLMRQRAKMDGSPMCFIGAGAYEHHIPTAVWDIATRGEFYSAYTPYQAEASQGTLQTIYEYQTMITRPFYIESSTVYVCAVPYLRCTGSLVAEHWVAYVVPPEEAEDINTAGDFQRIEYLIQRRMVDA